MKKINLIIILGLLILIVSCQSIDKVPVNDKPVSNEPTIVDNDTQEKSDEDKFMEKYKDSLLMLDGYNWVTWSAEMKSAYIIGIIATHGYYTFELEELDDPEISDSVKKKLIYQIDVGNYDKLIGVRFVEFVDNYYNDNPDNLNIPIIALVHFVFPLIDKYKKQNNM